MQNLENDFDFDFAFKQQQVFVFDFTIDIVYMSLLTATFLFLLNLTNMESILNSHQQDVLFSEMLETEIMKQNSVIFDMLKPSLMKSPDGTWNCDYYQKNDKGIVVSLSLIHGEGKTSHEAINQFVNQYKGGK